MKKKLQAARKELNKMIKVLAPRDKISCLLSCCKIIYSILNTTSNGNPPGADDFFPLMLYVTITANVHQIYSQYQYIIKFRNPEKLSETSYYLTNFESAISFIKDLTSDLLTISKEEFNKWMENGDTNIEQNNNTPLFDLKNNDNNDQNNILPIFDLKKSENNDQNNNNFMSSLLDLTKSELNEHNNNNIKPMFDLKKSKSESELVVKHGNQTQKLKEQIQVPSFSSTFLSAKSDSKSDREDKSFNSTIESDYESSYDITLQPFPTGGYQKIEMALLIKRFLSCNTEDIKVGEIPMLLSTFKKIVSENEILKEEIKQYKNQNDQSFI